jgi:hypothetical protein
MACSPAVSGRSSAQIDADLRAAGHLWPVEHVHNEGAGHALGQQLPDRLAEQLAFEIPEGDIHGGQGVDVVAAELEVNGTIPLCLTDRH